MLARLAGLVRRPGAGALLIAGNAALLALFLAAAALLQLRDAALAAVAIPLSFSLVALSLRRIRLDVWTIGIVLSGLGFYLVYLGYTSIGERNYDGPSQVEYIEHILAERGLPPASKCLICHHPPLYYLLGAGVHALFKATGLASPARGLQVFSAIITLFFIVFGVLTVRRFVKDPWLVRLAAAILVFWPYSVHNSVRVHNDTLVSALMVAALYFAVCWQEDDRPRDLYLASLFTALGALTKASAYPMVALLLALIVLRLWKRSSRLRALARGGAALLLLAAALLLNTLRKGDGSATEGGLCHKVLGSACDVNRAALMQNTPYNYLYLDVHDLLREPYILTDRDDTGRQLFWNHLLKSSLFGSHNKVPDPETAYELNRHIAGVMTPLLAALLGYFVLAAASAPRAALRRYGVLLLSLASFLGFLAGFRILLPAPHHTDFRHIFPALVPATILFVAAVGHFSRRERAIGLLGKVLILSLLGLSILYWMPKYELAVRLAARVVPIPMEAFGQPVAEGTPWDREGNLIFEESHTIQFAAGGRTVREIDVTLDSNDRYEISLRGAAGTRTVEVGPSGGVGLARYVEAFDPPVTGVKEITLRAVRGDRAYAMGHLLVR